MLNSDLQKIQYDVDFLENLKFENTEIPESLKIVNLTIIATPLEVLAQNNRNNNRNNHWSRNQRNNNGFRKNNIINVPCPALDTRKLETTENGWKREMSYEQFQKMATMLNETIIDCIMKYYCKQKPNTKKIKSLLNKVSYKNEEHIVNQMKNLNYTSPEVVEMIFQKAVAEPFFGELYASMCSKLIKLKPLIRNMCNEQFEKNKHKDLCNFIGELYKKKIILSIHGILDTLTSLVELEEKNIEKNIEILCNLIIVVGPTRDVFDNSFKFLENKKDTMKMRYKFMIMDVVEYKNGTRKPLIRKADKLK
jgi:hypothetical protein